MNLNTASWKEFNIVDFFDITAGIYHYPDEYGFGTTPYVTASNENNAIADYIDLEPDFKGNCITTGKVGCTAFYQPNDFCATSDVNVMIPKFEMSRNQGIFITVMINFNENYRWTYGRQCRVGNTKKIRIKLPTKEDGTPDFNFMDKYIDSINSKPLTTRVHKTTPPKINRGGDYKVDEIFDVVYGINMELNACQTTNSDDPDGIAFVARTSENNGVSAYVKIEDGYDPQPAGIITVAGGGSVLSTFYQHRPFYSGRDLYLLIAKTNISKYAKFFIATVLQTEQYRFNYGRQANKSLPKLNLRLPALDDGTPDYVTMESYIKSLPYSDRI